MSLPAAARLAIAGVALALAGCAPSRPLPADPSARLDPIAFFTGRTHGDAILQKLVGRAVKVRVDSSGRRDRQGGLILDQAIRKGGKPARHRRWLFRLDGRGRYQGSLTDAVGPVDFVSAGPRATIRYRMKNGMEVDQHLALQRDPRLVLNRLTVSKFGLRLATLDERIRKLD
ncbi:MAG: DUF3833 family protein [Sphingomicrobium sp.]